MKKSWLSVVTRYEKPGELKNLRCPADAKTALQEMAICGGADRGCLKTNPVLRLFEERRLCRMSIKSFHDYLVYSEGRIYSNLTKKFLKFDCYGSYAKVTLRIEGKPKRFSVHRLIAYLFCNPPANYSELDVDHLDNNHFNNSAENLEWVTKKENNRRAREKGFNNVSLNNSIRWNDKEFRDKTAKNISGGQIASGCFSGRRNPRYRFEIHGENGRLYMMSELTELTGKSLTWIYNNIIKFLNGEDVIEFKNCGIISIVDLKSKVNRLSKV